MVSESFSTASVVGRRMRSRREQLGWTQEKVGVLIGIDESASRARISRYELGTHEPPVRTARLLADALQVSLAYLYCEDDRIAELLLRVHQLDESVAQAVIAEALRLAQASGLAER